MTHTVTAIEEIVSQDGLTSLVEANGRCITATVSIPDPTQTGSRLNRAIHELEKRLKEADVDRKTAEILVEPMQQLATTIETEGDWGIALAMYRSSDTFRCFRLPEETRDATAIAESFQIRPLLAVISREQRFYLLALSQKSVRLFGCTHYRVKEIDLKGRTPQNLHVFLSTKMPDHVLDGRAVGGPSTGSMKGVLFGTNTDREKHQEYLAHFFREIDSGLQKPLASDATPLMLAGVEEEVALYRKINTYKYLMEHDVHGSPDGVTAVGLHRRALEIVRKNVSAAVRKILREMDGHRKAKRVSFDVADILAGAVDGRVGDLLVREDAELRGTYDSAGKQIRTSPDGEDMLNLAALETLRHKGQAFMLKASEMPEGAVMMAVYRY